MKLFGTMEVKNNELFIGGVGAKELVNEYKTPLYVMDERLLKDTCEKFYREFKCKEENNRVAFAGKSFLTMEMCRLINSEGLYLDVVSGGELFTAYKADFPMDRIYYHGNNKTLSEIKFGVEKGVGRFVVDNLEEMNMVNEVAAENNKKQDIYLRLTPGIEAHTHQYIQTGQIDSKFGFAPVGDNIMNAVKHALSLESICLKGLHCHIGSQIFELQPFADAAEVMLKYIYEIKQETGHIIEELDLGGGFGVYYTEEDKPKEINEYCNVILSKVSEVCKELGIEKPILTIEPGRSIVANAGVTLYTIGAIKHIQGVRNYVSVDGGMTDNIRPALYQANYEMALANKMDNKIDEVVTVAGKCCESGDILMKDVNFPKVEKGDILVTFTTGAYGFSMSSGYNKNVKPAVVFVNNGEVKVVSRRQDFEDLIALEI